MQMLSAAAAMSITALSYHNESTSCKYFLYNAAAHTMASDITSPHSKNFLMK